MRSLETADRQELLRISKVSAGLYRLWMRGSNTTRRPEFVEAPRLAIGVSSVARAIFVRGRETPQPRDPETPSHAPVRHLTSPGVSGYIVPYCTRIHFPASAHESVTPKEGA